MRAKQIFLPFGSRIGSLECRQSWEPRFQVSQVLDFVASALQALLEQPCQTLFLVYNSGVQVLGVPWIKLQVAEANSLKPRRLTASLGQDNAA
eukprot:scaffold277749_cov17-Tisochrysis_lutea.AAC.1